MSQISNSGSVSLDGTVIPGGTEGSIIFFDSSSTLAQDNANLFWNDSTNTLQVSNLNIGTADSLVIHGTSISSQFKLNSDVLSSTEVHTSSNSSTIAGGSIYIGVRSRGTLAAKTIVQNGDYLRVDSAIGYDGTDFEQAGYTAWLVGGTPGANDMPGQYVIAVTPDGGFTPAVAVTVNSDKSVSLADGLTVTGTTTLSALTAGSVLFVGSLKEITQDNSNLFWNDTNNFLGIGTASPTARLHVVQAVATSGSPTALLLAGGAHTTLAASTEAIDVNFNLARTVQFATGAKTNQRVFVIQAPTYSAVGATAITAMATFAVTGAPVAGTNISASDALAIWVQAGRSRFDGTIGIGSTSAVGPTLSITQAGQSGNVPPIITIAGGAHLGTASTELIDVNFNLSHTVTWGTGALATQRAFLVTAPSYTFSGASTITTAATFVITASPTAAANATITASWAAQIGGTVTIGPTSAGMKYASMNYPAHTVTVTGSTQVTTAGSFSQERIDTLTITDSSAVTIDTAASLYIASAPVAAGSVTLTDTYALFVDAGSSRFDGRILKAYAVVASATNLTLTGANGFELTGTTKVDLISNVGWTEGSVVTLVANESVVIDHGTATSGTNVQIRLAGAVDYSMTAGDTLTLCLSSTTAEGQAWREIGRAVI